jgi:hypothetical protein
MAARAGPHEIPITPQKRGSCDAKIKRLEVGTFQQLDPKVQAHHVSGSAGIELTVTELTLLLTGVDLTTARRRKRYTRAG